MERLLGPEEEPRPTTPVGSGGPDLGRLYSKSLATRLGLREYPTGYDCMRRVGVATLGGDGRRDGDDGVDIPSSAISAQELEVALDIYAR